MRLILTAVLLLGACATPAPPETKTCPKAVFDCTSCAVACAPHPIDRCTTYSSLDSSECVCHFEAPK